MYFDACPSKYRLFRLDKPPITRAACPLDSSILFDETTCWSCLTRYDAILLAALGRIYLTYLVRQKSRQRYKTSSPILLLVR